MHVYVAQVTAGTEPAAANTINRAAALAQVDLCAYVPQSESMRRYRGEWHIERQRLFPGYVFVQTDDVAGLRRCLRSISGPKKILGTELGPLSLTAEEVAWIDKLTAGDTQTHTVQMSVGVIVGDKVCVQSGPLVGHEALIRKIDRHRRTAEIELSLLGRSARVRVGLEIVAKLPAE